MVLLVDVKFTGGNKNIGLLIMLSRQLATKSQIFTSSDTWNNPGVDFVEIILVGGGGSGYARNLVLDIPYTTQPGGNSSFGSYATAVGGSAGTSSAGGKGGGKQNIEDAVYSIDFGSTGGNGGKYSSTYPEHVQGYASYDTIHWNNGGCSYSKGAIGSSSTDAEANGGGGGSSVSGTTRTDATTGGGGQIVHKIINVSGVSSVLVTIGAGGESNKGDTCMNGAAGRCEVYWIE